jgi:Uma2 family endonuclease
MPSTKRRPKAAREPRPKLWTRKEYYRLYDLGFFAGKRVELIEGEIIDMPPMNNPHAVALGLAHDALLAAFGTGFWVRDQMPLHFGSRSEPEPDIAVVPGAPRDFLDHPTTALLVMEISETSLQFDRTRKSSLYAEAGIADYWIVNLVDNQLEVCRDPQPDPDQVGRFIYAKITILKSGEVIAPLGMKKARIAVRDLLP